MYEQFHKLIYHIAYNMTNDPYLSQDIVQETFLKAFIKIDTLQDTNKSKSWLTSIARCTAIDYIRKESKRNEVFVEDHEEINQPLESDPLETEIEARFLKNSIHENISKLPQSQQDVMALKVKEDLSDREIALRLGLPPSTVKTRFHRARKHLYSIVYTKETA
ncbi:RNA polymerase sigma factor [Rossellomorea sp. AcN35-11]|nr:RNA polymerase sigma factor [Bacillus sp. RO3]WJV30236.1 RNA polymerase sigma factor [Rossellomorea sp. AcN35-11]